MLEIVAKLNSEAGDRGDINKVNDSNKARFSGEGHTGDMNKGAK